MNIILSSLGHLTDEIDRLLTLTGNCGRVVNRFFERCFRHDELGIECDMPSPVLLQRALFLSEVQNHVEKTNKHCRDAEAPLRVSVDAYEPSAFQVLVRVHLTHGVPESLRERRALLAHLCVVLACVQHLQRVDEAQLLRLQRECLDELTHDAADPSALAAYQQKFESLAAGDLTHLESTPLVLLGLAAMLSPSVAQAVSAQQTVEAAL